MTSKNKDLQTVPEILKAKQNDLLDSKEMETGANPSKNRNEIQTDVVDQLVKAFVKKKANKRSNAPVPNRTSQKDLSLKKRYLAMLRSYIASPGKEGLVRFSDYGHELVEAKLPNDAVIDIFEAAVHYLVQDLLHLPASANRVRTASASLMETMVAYGIHSHKLGLAANQAEERQRLVNIAFKTAAEAIMITDSVNKILYVNPAFTNITGYSREEVIGKNPRFLQSGRCDEAFYEAMWKAINTTGKWEGEIWNRKKSGEIYPEWLSITSAKDRGGNVVQYTGLFSDITQRKESQKNRHFQTFYDPLTQLPNQTLFFERLLQAVKQARRNRGKAALLLLDLDFFKQVDSSLGNLFRDDLLNQVSQRLLACVRETDTIARSGGDKFLIVLSEVSEKREIGIVATKIIERLRHPFFLNGHEIFLGANIGVSIAPDDGDDATILLKKSDMAMFRAKEKEKNAFCFFREKVAIVAHQEPLMEWDLKRAVSNQELCLYYQPILNLSSLKTVALEALIRWNHPQRGLVRPEQFIPLAEHSDLISQIGEWTLSAACTQVKKWQECYGMDTAIAVNLSSRELRSNNFYALLTRSLKESGLSPRSLIIEIKEGLMLDPTHKATKKLTHLKDAGVSLSIDDFGTGYSSLSYLVRCPVDFLKIDRSFIKAIESNPHKKSLVDAVVRMGQSMGMKTIAEGVETNEDLSYLLWLGCDMAQGNYFSEPLSTEEYEKVLGKLIGHGN